MLLIKWDSGRGKVVHTLQKRNKCLVLKCRIFMLLTFFHVLQNIFWKLTQNQNFMSLMDNINNWLSILNFIGFCAFIHIILKKASDITLYGNGLFSLLRRYPNLRSASDYNQSSSLVERLNLLVVCGMYFTINVIPPGFSYGLHWHYPCRPSLLGYWILAECGSSQIRSGSTWLSTKVGVFLVNQFMWTLGYQAVVLGVGVLQCLGSMLLLDCLRVFWVQFKHGGSCEKIMQVCELFREIQILATISNSISQRVLVNITFTFSILFHAFSFAITVVMLQGSDIHDGSEKIILLVFITQAVQTFLLIIVAFGGMSLVYKESTGIFWRIRNSNGGGMEGGGFSKGHIRWRRKFMNSCVPIKVKFGQNNFVEPLTPLNSINFSLGLIVQILLLRR